MEDTEYQRIRILVETEQRSFKGHLYKPVTEEGQRLSDYINTYGQRFLRLADVEVTERGQHYRVGDKIPFLAVSVAAITYIAPLEGE